jgi:acetate---CoA ligase (ADP-forming)
VRPPPRSRPTAVITNAGGPGILAADAMEACGLDLVELSPATVERLRPLFPPEASIRNPLDMIASATPAGYRTALAAILDDPNVDTVVPIFVPPFGIKQEDVAEAIVGASTGSEKPVLAVLMGRAGLPEGRAELHTVGIPAYIFPESAARAVAALNKQAEWSRLPLTTHAPFDDVDRDCARAILSAAAAQGREQLTTVEAMQLLRAYGVPVADGNLACDLDSAESIAEHIGYPVVLKLVSADVVHKSDVGGVVTNVMNGAHLRRAYEEMIVNVGAKVPDARIDGVLVQRQLRGGCETIVGVTRDPVFGPLVMFGLGGIFVEALRDVVFRLAPVDEYEANAMLSEIRGAKMLDGMRGAPASDKTALATAIRRIGQLAADFPQILELDVNPLLGFANGAIAVDARVTMSCVAATPASAHSRDAAPHR